MERDINHFISRLDKESYNKEDVAKLLHNEAQFTEQKIKKDFDGYMPQESLNELQTKFNEVETQLNTYKQKEFNDNVSVALAGVNGISERSNDFITLAGLKGTESQEEITNKAIEFKESKKYDFLFSNNESGAVRVEHSTKPLGINNMEIAPKAGFLNKLFK